MELFMLRWILGASGVFFLLAGCKNTSSDQTAEVLVKPALNRPIVAIVPMADCSRTDLKWSVVQELTQTLQDKFSKHKWFYLSSPQKTETVVKKLTNQHDPFGADIEWVRRSFFGTEFVVFTELVDHRETLFHPQDPSSSAELKIAVRIRVIDIRGSHPKIVLQEVIEQIQDIPPQFTKQNFSQAAWGTELYAISPLGLANAQLTQEIVSRVEDYILFPGGR